MKRIIQITMILTLCSIFLWINGCGINSSSDPDPTLDDPLHGEISDFISADAGGSQNGLTNKDYLYGGAEDALDTEAPTADTGDTAGVSRTVEEGDIYRVLENQRILNLNSYRGLQIIDFSDVENPVILGRLSISGWPVEMYFRGKIAYLLLNNWQGYYGNRDDIMVASYQGGLVVSVDISNPAEPKEINRAKVPGTILTSRLVQGGGKAALYIAANNWRNDADTVIRSIRLDDDGGLENQDTVHLGGYVRDIQATPRAMIVAQSNWNSVEGARNTVAVIDIADPDGAMTEGAQIPVAGEVVHKSNMDLYKGVLRVVSGSQWGTSNTNHLQTFDMSDIHEPELIDHDEFGKDERLEATLFLGNKAFFVTYFQIDPFHAFEIDDDGQAEEKSEYIISGWNDFFKPVSNDTRLIGIGKNDENGSTMAVSLYDITDLANPDPFIARAEVDMAYSWSEASWDDRAFSILENAVSVPGEGGVRETGMVLLPFSGYQKPGYKWVAGVQIFTFSDKTLTLRGIMKQGTHVRRSFMAQEETVANLSESLLSFFDIFTPDTPVELSRLDLAPNYTDFFIYGKYGARLKRGQNYYGWYEYGSIAQNNELQIIPLDEDPDTAKPLAVVSIPDNAQVYQIGNLAAAKYITRLETAPDAHSYVTRLLVIDLSDPLHPREASHITLDLPGSDNTNTSGAPEIALDECYDCYYPYFYQAIYPVGNSLVFPAFVSERELIGVERVCTTYPVQGPFDVCALTDNGIECSDNFHMGSVTCQSIDDDSKTCTGAIDRCRLDNENGLKCEAVDPDTVETRVDCYEYERYRYWSHLKLDVLDLSNPDDPAFAPTLNMPKKEQYVDLLVKGSDLYYSYNIPVAVANDGKAYARYFFKKVDLSNPAEPVMTPGINVPGKLLQVEGARVFTRDFTYGKETIESSLNRLVVKENKAILEATRQFPNQTVNTMLLDEAGNAIVSHGPYRRYYLDDAVSVSVDEMVTKDVSRPTLTILDAFGEDLPVLSRFEVDEWAQLRNAQSGRVLFSVPGGLLVINIEDPTLPYAQAFFPVAGWPQEFLVHDMKIIFAAGRYGVYQFGLDVFNLLTGE